MTLVQSEPEEHIAGIDALRELAREVNDPRWTDEDYVLFNHTPTGLTVGEIRAALASISSQISEAVKAERESCAKLAESDPIPPERLGGFAYRREIARAIRARGESWSERTELTCPCGHPLIRDGVVVKAHWTGAICEDCESDIFAKANGGKVPSDDLITQMVHTYDARYEELSEDTPDMPRDVKRENACIAVRRVMRHHAKTGKIVHWKDAS